MVADIIIHAEHGFVTADQARVSQILADYNPDLVILHIPPALQTTAEDREMPFCIVHVHAKGEAVIPGLGRADVVMHVRPDEMDHRVLEEVFKRDMKNDPMKHMVAANQAQAVWEAKQREEEMAQQRDIALSILKSPLHTYKHDGQVFR